MTDAAGLNLAWHLVLLQLLWMTEETVLNRPEAEGILS